VRLIGKGKAKQAEWNEKIEEMLNELDPSSDY
jgi:hypothetical protein